MSIFEWPFYTGFTVCTKPHLNSAPLEIFPAFLSSADFFQNQLLGKVLSGIPSECQTDWIQISPDVLSSLIWVQSACKGYQQMTLVENELNKPADLFIWARGLNFW